LVADFYILVTTSTTVVQSKLSSGTAPASATGGTWDFSTATTTTELSHLEGETVDVFADGTYLGQTTVTDGAIPASFVDGYTKIAVGLPYYSLFKTNKLNSQTPSGTARGKIKCIDEVAIEVYKSIGMTIGSADDTDTETNQFPVELPECESSTTWYTGIIPDINFDGRCDNNGYIVIKQSQPYPLNILGIYPRVQISEG
jgi:hypothetical protein